MLSAFKDRKIKQEIIFSAGNRNYNNGALNNQGSNGYYWSSSPNSTYAYNLNFNSTNVNPANNNNRANGFTARCPKDWLEMGAEAVSASFVCFKFPKLGFSIKAQLFPRNDKSLRFLKAELLLFSSKPSFSSKKPL